MIKRFFKAVLSKMIEHNQKRADYIVLTRLSDRELSDLGINRCDIKRIIYDS